MLPALAFAQARPARRPAAPAQAAMPAAAAHRDGTWELSAGVGGGAAAKAFTGTNSNVFGPAGFLRVGYNINTQWNVSVGSGALFGKSAATNLTAYMTPFAAVSWTPDINRPVSPFVSLGGGLLMRKNPSQTGAGALVGVGVRNMIGENLALRIEANALAGSFKATPNATATSTATGMVTVGLSYFFGGGPPLDTDGDGVPDKRDACPNTPRGATVDARGCPRDSDHDGVYDGIDRCPNTPPNTPVDANGCTLDSDHDGIPDNVDRCPNTPAGTPVDANGCPRDADNDGVPDNLDRCPNTPRGVPVETTGDRAGCPRDSDRDGVPDYQDRCPNTPPNTPVDANGCPRDSDGDGVPDNIDRCPNTPPGTPVDAAGCPVERDSDGDGVPDSRDRCPNTPHGARVDANGCPMAELPQVGAVTVLRNVNFLSNGFRLTPQSREPLDQIARAILAMPGSRWEVAGYTDSRGSALANRRLSQRRAQAVATYLVSKGVPAGQLVAVGRGPVNPVAPNTTLAGRAENRRVEVKRLQ